MILLAIALLHTVSSASLGTPTIVHVSDDATRDVGQDFELSCTVKDLQDGSIQWLKGFSESALTSNSEKVAVNSRYRLQFQREDATRDSKSTLKISNIRGEDAGNYTCRVLLRDDVAARRTVQLSVKSPAVIISNISSVIINASETARLECETKGIPPPKVTWTREKNLDLPNLPGVKSYVGDVLVIKNAQREHAGNYHCEARNEDTNKVMKTISLKVQYKPTVVVQYPVVKQALTFKANLQCAVSGVPEPEITWYRGTQKLQPDQYFTFSSSANEGNTTSTLRIESVEARHYGEYTCRAENRLGEDFKSMSFASSPVELCAPTCGSGHNIFSFLDLKLSVSAFLIIMLNWQNM